MYRLETLVDQWDQFERDAATLEMWLATALNHLPELSAMDTDETEDIGVLRQKMELFLVSTVKSTASDSFIQSTNQSYQW